MLFTWFNDGVMVMLAVRAMFTPFATMLPAALTRLMAEAFCWAVPDRSMLELLVAVRVDPSTAMFWAEAASKLTAPCTVLMMWRFLTAVLLLELDFEVERLAVVLVELLSVELAL